jgi:molybdopterin/thiamine biosynthesis adenylyltransferase
MSRLPVNPSPDIIRLRNEGYEVEIRGAHLLVSHVPCVNSARQIEFGTLVSTLALAGNTITKPDTHVAHFIGPHPCHKDGSILHQIQHASQTQTLAEGIVVTHSFSNKPKDGYPDYYEKMSRYAEIISAPAQSLDPTVTAKTFRVIEAKPEESVFNYHDTNSSRAEIEAISAKLKGRKIGIVGLGGTGSYVLDLVAKTPVDEVHLFDADVFCQHNAFRAPGAPSVVQLRTPPAKVNYLAEIYSRMRRGIVPHAVSLNAMNLHLLDGLDFVFICIDEGRSKREIVELLEASAVSFIDVGMGVQIGDNSLLGILRVTTSTPRKRDHVVKCVSLADAKDDAYSTNIQIADLNMLNAALAVIKWKKLCGFYQDAEHEHHCTYSINVNQLLSGETQP